MNEKNCSNQLRCCREKAPKIYTIVNPISQVLFHLKLITCVTKGIAKFPHKVGKFRGFVSS